MEMRSLEDFGHPLYSATKCGQIYSHSRNRCLKPVHATNGYNHVTLVSDVGRNNYSIHRLIMIAFEPRSDYKEMEVNHKNGIKTDNRLENLEWVTRVENSRHAIETGLRHSQKHAARSISNELAHEVCQLLENNFTNTAIAKITGVPARLVAKIRYGSQYKDVSSQYNVKGTISSRRKLSDEKVIEVCEMLAAGCVHEKIVRELKIGTATLTDIYHKRRYKHISDNYF